MTLDHRLLIIGISVFIFLFDHTEIQAQFWESAGTNSIKQVGSRNSIYLGNNAGDSTFFLSQHNVFLGEEAGRDVFSGSYNFMAGYSSGKNSYGGWNNVYIGRNSGEHQVGNGNIGIGYFALWGKNGLSNGVGNIGFGNAVGAYITTGSKNIFIGDHAGFSTEDGFSNIALGADALRNNLSGSKNVALGYQAGYHETGSDRLYIDNSSSSSPLIYGEFDKNLVRINGDLKTSKSLEVEDGSVSYGISKYSPIYGFYMKVHPSVTGGWARNLSSVWYSDTKKGIIYAYGTGSNLHRIGIDATGLNHTSKQFIVHSNGNIGINSDTPSERLEVVGNIKLGSASEDADLKFISTAAGENEIKFTRGSSSAPYFQIRGFGTDSGTNEETAFFVNDNEEIEAIRFKTNGEIEIKEKLFCENSIKTTEVQVQPSPWPDYVFDPSYDLKPLSEVETHIKNNGHLEGIPNAEEVEDNGIAIGEMNAKLLEKIEELTLYLIEQDKRLELQSIEIENLKTEITKLKKTNNDK